MARHVGRFKLGLKPAQFYVGLSILPLRHQAICQHGNYKALCSSFCLIDFALPDARVLNIYEMKLFLDLDIRILMINWLILTSRFTNTKRLRNCIHTFIFIFFMLLSPKSFFAHDSIEYEWFSIRSIWPIDATLTGTTTRGQSGPGSNDHAGVLYTPKIWREIQMGQGQFLCLSLGRHASYEAPLVNPTLCHNSLAWVWVGKKKRP